MATRHQNPSSGSASVKARRTPIIKLLRQVKDAYTLDKIKQAKEEYEGLLSAEYGFHSYPGKEYLPTDKQEADRIEALSPLKRHAGVLYDMLTTERDGVSILQEAQDELCRLLVIKEAFDLLSSKQLDEKKKSRLCELPDTVTIPVEDYEEMRRKMRLQRIEIDELNARSSRRQHQGHYVVLGPSNPIRPTKVGEMYDSLFDLQWHDALPTVKELYEDETEAFIFLRDLLLKSYDFCSEIAKDEHEKLVSHLNKIVLEPTLHMEGQIFQQQIGIPMGTNCAPLLADLFLYSYETEFLQGLVKNKKMKEEYRKRSKEDSEVAEQNEMYAKEIRKATATKSLPSLISLFKKLYLQEHLNWTEFQYVDRLGSYLDKCVEITWLMSVHDPPMRFVVAKSDEAIDLSKFMYFKVKGRITDFTLWPALVLFHGGPVIRHGHVVPKRHVR